MVARNLAGPLCELASQMPVVAVTGPRHSGKTTLCRQWFPNLRHVSLERVDTREFARRDPRGFLKQHRDGAVLDEIQRVPELFSHLRAELDADPAPGRFVLTGSQQIRLTEPIWQPLASRMSLLNLLPPSLDELSRFGKLPADLWNVVLTGAYPRIHDRNLDPGEWLADYISAYLQRDVRQVLNVTNLDDFTGFLRLLAGRTASELNLSALGNEAGITHNTARAWVSVLESSFLCFRLPGWRPNARRQTVKAPKIHFVDTGLACQLLGIGDPDHLRHHLLRGALFESWVAGEVFKSRLHRGLPAGLFHYRDSKNVEVDLLIEEGGRLTAVDVETVVTVVSNSFGALGRFGQLVEKQAGHPSFHPRVVYGGEGGEIRPEAEVVPWGQIHSVSW